jgi:hydroxyacylglutathione hydrolase
MDTRPAIHTIALGVCNVYVIRDQGTIAIEGGAPNKADLFRKGLGRIGVAPEEIGLLILTHGHWDHIGSARAIQEMTGAAIAMHESERDCLEQSVMRFPPGTSPWSRFLVRLMGRFVNRITIEPARVDRVLNNGELSLADDGVAGTVLHTPGHSQGSVSVLLDSGDCIVGDLAMNGFPLRFGPGLPIFADDLDRVRQSWRSILDRGAKTIYPAHGKPFSADVLRNRL